MSKLVASSPSMPAIKVLLYFQVGLLIVSTHIFSHFDLVQMAHGIAIMTHLITSDNIRFSVRISEIRNYHYYTLISSDLCPFLDCYNYISHVPSVLYSVTISEFIFATTKVINKIDVD